MHRVLKPVLAGLPALSHPLHSPMHGMHRVLRGGVVDNLPHFPPLYRGSSAPSPERSPAPCSVFHAVFHVKVVSNISKTRYSLGWQIVWGSIPRARPRGCAAPRPLSGRLNAIALVKNSTAKCHYSESNH